MSPAGAGARNHSPPAPEVGLEPLALGYPGAGAQPGSRAFRAARAGPGCARTAQSEVCRAGAAVGRRAGRAGAHGWASAVSSRARIKLDLGFSRGIGFYTQMIFELEVSTPARARSTSAAAAATTVWPASWAAAATTAAPASPFGLERLAQACAGRAISIEKTPAS